MRVLVTGADGFTGRYLAPILAADGHEVIGLASSPAGHDVSGITAWCAADLRSFDAVKRAVVDARPDAVVHLAAISFVAHGDVESMYAVNVLGSRNLLESLVQSGLDLQCVLLASSANIYGNSDARLLDESCPAAPANDYAVTKLAMEYIAGIYRSRLPLTIVRPFNYTGIGQSPQFLVPKIVSHFATRAPVIELGNLDVARDFSDVRDVAAIYARLLQAPGAVGGVFNVSSGRAWPLAEIIQILENLTGHRIEVRSNPAFVRKNEVRYLAGSCARLGSVIGDMKRIGLEDTLRWMVGISP